MNVDPRRINEVVLGKRAITPDTALRLAKFFGMSEPFWIDLQSHYDLEIEKERLSGRLDREVRSLAQSS
ncbi:MAG: HigA family addiction module antidote protein [Dethiobacter sp.]|nr:HigA family addiction module antidote protein [Dethiobacter sp.]